MRYRRTSCVAKTTTDAKVREFAKFFCEVLLVKPANAEMVANLAWFTQGLGFPEFYGSRNIRPFIWEVAERGALTAEQLMLSNIIWGNKR